jgi:hypothetical protein
VFANTNLFGDMGIPLPAKADSILPQCFMKLKAKLKNLEGKYYSTIIEIIDEETSKVVATVNVERVEGSYTPSERELEPYELTEQQWEENYLIPDLDGEEMSYIPCQQAELFVDSHYETKETYEIALQIVEHFNSEGRRMHNTQLVKQES